MTEQQPKQEMKDVLMALLVQVALNPRLWVAVVAIAVTAFGLGLDPEVTGALIAVIVAAFLGIESSDRGLRAALELGQVLSKELSEQRLRHTNEIMGEVREVKTIVESTSKKTTPAEPAP